VAVSEANRPGLVNLVLAQGISATGDLVLLTAASVVVFEATNSATAVSLLLGIAALPTVLFGPLAGAFADRFSRKRILVVADLLAALTCGFALLIGRMASDSVTGFFAIALVASLGAFYRPAAQALLPSLAADSQLGRANSALRLATSLANIAGPAAAAVAVQQGGLNLVLWADGASFLVSAGLVLMIQRTPALPPQPARKNPFLEAREGFAYTSRHPQIRLVAAAVGVVLLAGTLVNAGTLPLVARSLDLPESRYGALLAIEGAGAMGLAVWMLVLGPGARLLVTGSFALIGVGASTILLGGAPGFGVAAAAILVQGATVVTFQVAFASYLQREAADAFRGRVMSLVSMIASLAQLLGYALAGPLVEWRGPRFAFVLAGVAVLAVAVPVVALTFGTAREERLTEAQP
jgi:MFS family permease